MNSIKGERTITIVSIYYPPEKGAAASRIQKLAHGLQARGARLNVVTALPNYPTGRIYPDYRGTVCRFETVDQVPVNRYWLYPSISSNPLKRILNIVSFSVTVFLSLPRLWRIRPRTIIVNCPPLPVSLSTLLLGRILRARVVVNVSDIWPLSALELGAIRKGRLYSVLERMELAIYRRSDAIMTQSEETRQHVLARCPEKKAFLYRNLDYRSRFIDHYPPIDDRPVKLIYAGLLGIAQGVYDICKAVDFRSLGAELHLYGDGNERSKIASYVSDKPDCGVFVHDSVEKSEMPAILAQFHATIIPLRKNIRGAFPSKLYMAISASLPVLFSGSGEGARFVHELNIGWVSAPGHHDGLSENIAKLAGLESGEYRNLRDRIRSVAEKQFDLDDQFDRLVEFIDSIECPSGRA